MVQANSYRRQVLISAGALAVLAIVLLILQWLPLPVNHTVGLPALYQFKSRLASVPAGYPILLEGKIEGAPAPDRTESLADARVSSESLDGIIKNPLDDVQPSSANTNEEYRSFLPYAPISKAVERFNVTVLRYVITVSTSLPRSLLEVWIGRYHPHLPHLRNLSLG